MLNELDIAKTVYFYLLDSMTPSTYVLFPGREVCLWTYARLIEQTIELPADYRKVTENVN